MKTVKSKKKINEEKIEKVTGGKKKREWLYGKIPTFSCTLKYSPYETCIHSKQDIDILISNDVLCCRDCNKRPR